jgi:hypothetical protein
MTKRNDCAEIGIALGGQKRHTRLFKASTKCPLRVGPKKIFMRFAFDGLMAFETLLWRYCLSIRGSSLV